MQQVMGVVDDPGFRVTMSGTARVVLGYAGHLGVPCQCQSQSPSQRSTEWNVSIKPEPLRRECIVDRDDLTAEPAHRDEVMPLTGLENRRLEQRAVGSKTAIDRVIDDSLNVRFDPRATSREGANEKPLIDRCLSLFHR